MIIGLTSFLTKRSFMNFHSVKITFTGWINEIPLNTKAITLHDELIFFNLTMEKQWVKYFPLYLPFYWNNEQGDKILRPLIYLIVFKDDNFLNNYSIFFHMKLTQGNLALFNMTRNTEWILWRSRIRKVFNKRKKTFSNYE